MIDQLALADTLVLQALAIRVATKVLQISKWVVVREDLTKANLTKEVVRHTGAEVELAVAAIEQSLLLSQSDSYCRNKIH